MQDKYVSKQYLQTYFTEKGFDATRAEKLVNDLSAKGYTIEGYNDQPKEPSSLDIMKDKAKEVLVEPFTSRINAVSDKALEKNLNPVATGLMTGAAGISGAYDVLGKGVGSALSGVAQTADAVTFDQFGIEDKTNKATQFIGNTIGEGVEGIVKGVSKLVGYALTPEQQAKVIETANKYPSIANSAEALAIIALEGKYGGLKDVAKTSFNLGKGATIAGKDAAVATANKVGTTASGVVDAVAPAVKSTVQVTKDLGSGMKSLGQSGADIIVNTPGRIATNVAAKQAIQKELKALPSDVARKAVVEGVDLVDAKSLSNIVKPTPQVSKLVDSVKKLASGDTMSDPIAVIGEPVVNTLKLANEKANVIGKQLGELSKKVTVVDPQDAVFSQLRSVKGLDGLNLTTDGVLDFSNTVLSEMSNPTKKYIQKVFTQASKTYSGEKANMLRQELFEILGGKKKALVNMTGTEENAVNAIRQGLADSIEQVNPGYKALSEQYAKTIQPIQELQKALKSSTGESVDIMNETAGLLARRLTSTAISRPQIQKIFNAIDKAAGTNVLGEVTNLQDIYNILNKYYDIAPKTGFQALSRNEVTQGINPVGRVLDAVQGFAGSTNATRSKALEDLLNSLLEQSK